MLVDLVAIKCKETRYYHEFGESNESILLKERREYAAEYGAFFNKHTSIGKRDIDRILEKITEVSRITEEINL